MRYFDREGNPIDPHRWADLLHDAHYKTVATTPIAPGVTVSTVWLGLDHNWTGGAPHIFETMIFGGALDQECWRYSSETAALEGHRQAAILAHSEADLAGGAPG